VVCYLWVFGCVGIGGGVGGGRMGHARFEDECHPSSMENQVGSGLL